MEIMVLSKKQNRRCYYCKSNSLKQIYKLKRFRIFKCLNCGLIMKFSPNQKSINKRIYDKKWIKARSQNNSLLKHRYRQLKQYLSKISNCKEYNSFLEIGPGTGEYMSAAKKLGFETIKGIEMSRASAEYLKDQRFDVIKGDIIKPLNIPADMKFDVILLSHVVEHIKEPKKLFNKLSRILTKKGVIIIATPNYDSIDRILFGRFWPAFNIKDHVVFFNKKVIEKVIEKTPLKIKKWWTGEGGTDIIGAMLSLFINKYKKQKLNKKNNKTATSIKSNKSKIKSSILKHHLKIRTMLNIIAEIIFFPYIFLAKKLKKGTCLYLILKKK